MEDSTLNPDEFYDALVDREKANWDKMYENYDAAVDWPTCAFYKDLLKKYPDAMVILTVRSPESWYESAKNTIHQSAVFNKNNLPKDHPLYSFGRMCNKAMFDGDIADAEKFKNEEYTKKLFMDHIKDVKKNVPQEQLYVMELGEGWDGLCQFLGKQVPKVPYPKSNSTKKFQETVSYVFKGAEKVSYGKSVGDTEKSACIK